MHVCAGAFPNEKMARGWPDRKRRSWRGRYIPESEHYTSMSESVGESLLGAGTYV